MDNPIRTRPKASRGPIWVAASVVLAAALLAVPASVRADLTFDYEGQIKGNGKAKGELKTPLGVAVDPAGHVLVTEYAAHRVQLFDSFEKGNVPFNIFAGPGGSSNVVGGPGQGPGQFDKPFGIATNPDDGSVYVADTRNDRVQKFAPFTKGVNYMGGFLLPEIPGTGDARTPTGIAAYGDNYLYVTSSDGPMGNLAFKVAAVVSEPPQALGPEYWKWFGWFGMPTDAAVDPEGRVYVTDLAQHYVSIYAPSAQGTKLLRVIGGWGTEPGKLNYPAGVETDSLGRVYVTEYGGATGPSRIQVFSSYEQGNESLATVTSVPGNVAKAGPLPFNHLVGIALDGTRLYVTDISCVSEDIEPCAPDAKSSDSVWRLRFDDADADGVFDSTEPKPPASASGEASAASPGSPQPSADTTAPLSRVTQPRGKRASAWRKRRGGSKRARSKHRARSLRQIVGYAVDGESGVAKVEIAFVKRTRSRCRALTRSGLRRSSCKKLRFLEASLLDSPSKGAKQRWKMRLTRRQQRALVAGRYEIVSRATDLAGNVEQTLRRAGNFKRLKLR